MTTALVLALLPTFFVIGPLALPVLLLVAALGGLALFLRRWLVLLGTAGLACAAFWAQAWFHGRLAGSWWGTPRALWIVLVAMALVGVGWSWWRHRAAVRRGEETEPCVPGRMGAIILGAAGVICLAVGVCIGTMPRGLLAAGVVMLAGAGYAGLAQCVRRRAGASPRLPAAETLMLVSLAGVGAVLAWARPMSVAPLAVTVLWRFEPPQPGAIISSPVVDADRVYVAAIRDSGTGSSGVVYALERDTGHVRWSFDDGGTMQHTYSTPCLAGGRLYVGEGMHSNLQSRLYCLDATSGRKLWDFRTAGHVESSPCAGAGGVFFGAGDDGLYCLDGLTGARRWRFEGGLHIDTSPALADGCVYGGSGLSRLRQRPEAFALDARTGTPRWRIPTDLPVWGSPRVVGNRVYMGLGSGRLLEDRGRREAPAGAILCLETATGQVVWRQDLGDAVFGRPVVSAGRLVTGTRAGDCWCLDAGDGRLLWRQPLGSPVLTQPALNGDAIVVAARDGRVCRLDAASGRPAWWFDLAAYTGSSPRLLSSPAVVADAAGGHRIYVGAELRNPVISAATLLCLQDGAGLRH